MTSRSGPCRAFGPLADAAAGWLPSRPSTATGLARRQHESCMSCSLRRALVVQLVQAKLSDFGQLFRRDAFFHEVVIPKPGSQQIEHFPGRLPACADDKDISETSLI